MEKRYKILTINPGSTSTKIAVFDNEKSVMQQTIRHSAEELALCKTIWEQFEFREKTILDIVRAQNIDLSKIDAIVGRGGLLRPMESGTYRVNEKMISDLKTAPIAHHASNLGAIIAYKIARSLEIPAYITDPVVVDELEETVRISGMPEIRKVCIFHALNQKSIGRKVAKELGKVYEELNLIIAHLGGGITVGAHRKGRVADVNNALEEGPFTPERTGSLPSGALVELCYSGKYTLEEMKSKLVGKGGLVAYLGTNDGRVISDRIREGDQYAELVYRAMAHQISKEIGACLVVLKGKVDAICITGGLAHDDFLIGLIKESIAFIGDVRVYPGEDEMAALAEGCHRILCGIESEKEYL